MRATGDYSDQGRLALALLLAFGLHTALLFGVSADWRQSFQQPAPPPFEIRLTSPEPGLMAVPVEPALMEWLPPAPPRSALPKTTVLESPTQPNPKPLTPKPVIKPVIKPAPKPPPEPVAKPASKPTPQPLPKPVSRPKPRTDNPPPPKLVAPVKSAAPPKLVAPVKSAAPPTRRFESERSRNFATVTPAPGKLDTTALLGQIASLETDQQRKESANVRTQRVSLTDTRSAAGFYAADWARKVTRVGEMNFPDAARRLKTSAGPLLEVVIRADGRLQEVRVIRSSGHVELDQAAQRIVKLAAPYPPFPAELRQQIDWLRIESPWRFDPGGKIRAR